MALKSFKFRFQKSVAIRGAGVVMGMSTYSRTIQASSEREALAKLKYALESEAGGHAVQIFLV